MKTGRISCNVASFTAGLLLAASLHAATLEELLFTVQRDGRETGSGFLLKDSNGVWMVSNCHVVRQRGKIEFKGLLENSRSLVLPERLEVAANRDAVRFCTSEPEGLALTDKTAFDEPVFAFGNSDGAGVITKNAGKIVGKGRGEIEVTCEIIPGNSGGPVINASNQVIGIATYTMLNPSVKMAAQLSGTVSAAERERLAERMQNHYGTRYTKARRFAVSLHDADWQLVALAQFQKESADYETLETRYETFRKSIPLVFRCQAIPEENQDVFARGWLRTYNRELAECGEYDSESGRYYVRAGRQETFERFFDHWMLGLSQSAGRLAEEFRQKAEPLTIRYYQKEAATYAEQLDGISRDLKELASKRRR